MRHAPQAVEFRWAQPVDNVGSACASRVHAAAAGRTTPVSLWTRVEYVQGAPQLAHTPITPLTCADVGSPPFPQALLRQPSNKFILVFSRQCVDKFPTII